VRARARARSGDQNLDSLLDTMANVTGILIVLLAVTQISVGDAMDRLRDQLAERPELTPESLASAEVEMRGLRAALAPLLPRAEDLARRRDAAAAELDALRQRIDEAEADIEAAQGGPIDPDAVRREIALQRQAERVLSDRLASIHAEIASVEGALSREGASATFQEARLPDPRPPPRNAGQYVFFCRYGRVAIGGTSSSLLAPLRKGTRAATNGAWEYGRTPDLVDRAAVVRYFRRNDVGTSAFRWHMVDNGITEFWAELHWRSERYGETLAELQAGRADFAREIARLDPSRTFLNFWVWEDSFDVYVRAREIAEAQGFAVGWVPRSLHTPFRQDADAPSGAAGVD
jgi:hypothetical protein